MYGQLVGAMEEFLGGVKDMKDVLLVLSGTCLVPYRGYYRESWYKLGLIAGNKQTPNSQVWLVKSGAMAEEQMDIDCDDDVLLCHKKFPSGSAPLSYPQSPSCTLLRHPISSSKAQLHNQKSPNKSLPQHKQCHDNVLPRVRESPGFAMPRDEKFPVVRSSNSHSVTNGHGCLPDSEVIVPINACVPGIEVTVCGVVTKGMVEFEGDLEQDNGAVVDPSCLEEGAEYRELLVIGEHNFTAGIIVLLKNIQVSVEVA